MVKVLAQYYEKIKNHFVCWQRKRIIKHRERGNESFVFENGSTTRWIVIKSVFFSLVILSLIVLVTAGLSVYMNPLLPKWGTKAINEFSNVKSSGKVTTDHLISANANSNFQPHDAIHTGDVYAFYVNWDENGEQSLKRNLDTIDVLIPQWFHLQSNLELGEDIQQDIGKLAKKNHVKVVPLVSNLVDDKWNQEVIHSLVTSPGAQSKLIQELHEQIKKNGYDGINIDFENINVKDKEGFTAFMKELYSVFHADNLLVTLDMPPADPAFDYKELEKYADRMIVMLYDENFQSPGPISSSIWYQENLARIPKDKLIVSLGNYGYDWEWESDQPGKVVSFETIMRMADKAKLPIQWDDMSKSPYIRYMDKDKEHEIWFLDSVTFYNQLKMASVAGVKGVALWRLGTEDPLVWDVLKNRGIDAVRHVKSGEGIYGYGQGAIFQAASDQEEGRRKLIFDKSGQISSEAYTSLPKSFEMERLSKPKAKEIALTFDDGPDPNYTQRILNILDHYQIKATFFVIGENALVNQDIMKRMYRDGHEIGNHTFFHPDTNAISYDRLKLELNANERVIQGITGHSSLLYRPPYGYTDENIVNSDFQRMLYTTRMGYITVHYDIDSMDWKVHDSKKIAANIMKQLPRGNIVLLHDGGGDRTSTVQVLPKVIEELQSKGYTFVTVSELMHTNKNQIMPPLKAEERPLVDSIKITLGIAGLKGLAAFLFYSVLCVSVLRLFMLAYFALQHKKRAQLGREGTDSFQPLVSVVIAAYNEEKVITRTIQSVLKSDYTNYEIIIVDDGSTDQTSMIVSQNFHNNDKIHLIRKENGGKSSAINRGIQMANGDIIIAIDADTIVVRDAISLLVRHFRDEKVAAVSGNVKVGNKRNALTIWQHVEYVTGFNLEKRAFGMLNCVTVVPGAVGAWRKQVIVECGYFTEDTLAEDTDMTLRILRQGYKVMLEEHAYAYTEAPEDIRGFLKQRYRWTYGTLQCLWKHKRACFTGKHKTLRYIAIPNMLLFQFVLPVTAPYLDAVALLGILSGEATKALVFSACFFIIDFCICVFAFRLEKLSLKPLISLFLQRLFYRYVMFVVVWKSIQAAIKGTRVGWNKLQRSGNLEVSESVKQTG